MKKIKKITAMILVVSLIFIFSVSYSAESLSENTNINNYKIDTELQEIMEETPDDELIKVALWLSDVDMSKRSEQISTEIRTAEANGELVSTFMSETDLSSIETYTMSREELSKQAQTLVELKRGVEKDLHSENNTGVLNALGSWYNVDIEPLFVSNYAPLVIMEITKDDIYSVANSASVEKVYYHNELDATEESLLYADNIDNETRSANQYPYGVWQNITNINVLRDAMGFSGSGVKIGLLEQDVANFDYTNNSIEDNAELYEQFSYHIENGLIHFDTPISVDDNASHANYTLSILSGFTDEYEGVAPLAEIYCAGRDNNDFHYFESIDRLIDVGVNIISASIYWEWAVFNNGYDYVSRYVDYVVSNANVTLCFAAGNIENGNPRNKLCSAPYSFNVIAVGNIDDKGTQTKSDDERSASSLYNYLSTDTYKPDICAPGSKVSTYVAPNVTGGGTSAACPVVAGVCALLMEAFPELKTDPMLLKSLLMASARELASMTDIYSSATSVEPALTRECGPGMIDAYRAYSTYLEGNYTSRGMPYIININHTASVSDRDILNEKDMYISLNWLQWNTVNGENWTNENNYNVLNGLHLTLSLYDPDGDLVAVSDYQYDRKQFIRYKPLVAGEYRVKITGSCTSPLDYYAQLAVAHCIK